VCDKEILSFREHFYRVDEVPHFTCILTYQVPAIAPETREPADRAACGNRRSSASNGKRPARRDPLAGLDERQLALFNTLREWRAGTAREEGVPPYVVFTNRQLVQIVRHTPKSPTALSNLDGIGPGKVKRYGREILARLNGFAPGGATVPAVEEKTA